MKIEGIVLAAITPFKEEKIDFDSIAFNFERWNQSDVSGYVIMGSTGEFVSLLHEEKRQLMAAARKLIPSEKKLLVGVGCHSVFETVQLANHAEEIGADALLVVTPHYYSSKITTLFLRHYYMAIASRVSLPIYSYNIPQFTNVNISTELVKVLCGDKVIDGIKDSTGDLSRISELTGAE